MNALGKDLAFAARVLRKAPGTTAAVVGTLAVGIAAATTTFSLLNSFFIRPLAAREPERLVRIYTNFPGGPRHFTVAYPDFFDLRELRHLFEDVLAEEPVPTNLAHGDGFERVWGLRVSSGYFSLLGLRPALGRFFDAEEDAGPARDVVVVGHGFWKRRYAGSSGVLGELLVVDARPRRIVGVAPEGFHGLNLGLFPDVWLPPERAAFDPGDRAARAAFALARLRPGVGLAEVGAALEVLARRLEHDYPGSNRGIRFVALPESEGRLHPLVRGGVQGFTLMLFASAGILLLLACANVAAVQLARGLSRRREIATRLALGASRGRIVRLLLTENGALSLVAGVLGLLLAYAAAEGLRALPLPTARGAPLAFDVSLDGRVLGFCLLVAVVAGVAFGLGPALQAARSDLLSALQDGTSSSPGRRSLARSSLVAVQAGLSTVLLIGGALFLRSFENARRVDLGFDPDDVVVASVDVAPRGGASGQWMDTWRRITDGLSASPGLGPVSLTDRVPFEVNVTLASVAAEGMPRPESGWPTVDFAVVDRAYFETLRIPLLEGREFGERDTAASRPVAVINEALAQRFWPGRSAIGQRLVRDDGPVHEVVGVARTAKYLTLGEDPKPYLYVPLAQNPSPVMTVIARGNGEPSARLRELREGVSALDDRVPVYNLATLKERMKLAFLPAASAATVLGAAALVALALTGLGLYATVAYTVDRRTHEIGVRRALGAPSARLLRLVMGREAGLVGLGLVAGGLIGFLASPAVASFLHGVEAADPVAFGAAAAVLGLACLLAAWVPARRALRIEPARALRHE